MPSSPRRPAELSGRCFRGSTTVAAGLLTPNQLRGTAWRRLFRDVYVCASLPLTHELRAVAAAGLLLPGAVVTGRSAAVLWGVELADRDDDVELTVSPGGVVSSVPGVRVRRARLDPTILTTRREVAVTMPAATAVEVARPSTS